MIKLKLKKGESKENRYFGDHNIAGVKFKLIDLFGLRQHVLMVLKDIENEIKNKSLPLEEVKKLIEERLREWLNRYQDIEKVEFEFDDHVAEDLSDSSITSRTHLDSWNLLTVSIANGPEIQLVVDASYTITKSEGKAYLSNFKLNDVIPAHVTL